MEGKCDSMNDGLSELAAQISNLTASQDANDGKNILSLTEW